MRFSRRGKFKLRCAMLRYRLRRTARDLAGVVAALPVALVIGVALAWRARR
jgi:hypothetical protein